MYTIYNASEWGKKAEPGVSAFLDPTLRHVDLFLWFSAKYENLSRGTRVRYFLSCHLKIATGIYAYFP